MNELPSDSTYDYMCNECGMTFESIVDYLDHCRKYHPKALGTAIT
jgi:predicted nucleic acid-binding Zn ribbon protein